MKINQTNIDQLIETAEQGDKVALSRLYGQASAWLKSGKAPPEPLGAWIADRLSDLSGVLSIHYDRKQTTAHTAQAMKVTRKGARGRAPQSATSALNKALAQDVQHFKDWHDMKDAKAIASVAAMHENRDGINRLEQIKAAWKKYGN